MKTVKLKGLKYSTRKTADSPIIQFWKHVATRLRSNPVEGISQISVCSTSINPRERLKLKNAFKKWAVKQLIPGTLELLGDHWAESTWLWNDLQHGPKSDTLINDNEALVEGPFLVPHPGHHGC